MKAGNAWHLSGALAPYGVFVHGILHGFQGASCPKAHHCIGCRASSGRGFVSPQQAAFAAMCNSFHWCSCWLQGHPVVGAYMEFAERKVLPQHQHLAAAGALQEQHRRDGFEAESATNIFASTTEAARTAQQQGVL